MSNDILPYPTKRSKSVFKSDLNLSLKNLTNYSKMVSWRSILLILHYFQAEICYTKAICISVENNWVKELIYFNRLYHAIVEIILLLILIMFDTRESNCKRSHAIPTAASVTRQLKLLCSTWLMCLLYIFFLILVTQVLACISLGHAIFIKMWTSEIHSLTPSWRRSLSYRN